MNDKLLKAGLTSVTFRSVDAFDIIEYCKKYGIETIEWGSDIHVPYDNTENAEKVKKACDDAGIEIISYGSYYRCGTYENHKEVFAQYLAIAKILGAKIIRIWVGDRNYEDADREYIEKTVNELKDICHIAESADIDIGCELHEGTLCNRRKASLDIVNRVGCDNFGMYFQYDPRISTEENFATLTSFLPVLKNIHVFYANSKFERFSLSCDGAKNLWREFIKIYKTNKSKIGFILEFLPTESEECLGEEVKAFNKLLAE